MNYEEATKELFSQFKFYVQAKVGLSLNEVEKKETSVEKNIKECYSCNRRLQYTVGGLWSSDVALDALLCEKDGVPRHAYCYGLDFDGHHMNFCYSKEAIKALKKEENYHLAEIVRIRALNMLNLHFDKSEEISKEEIEDMMRKSMEEELEERRKVSEEFKKKFFGAT